MLLTRSPGEALLHRRTASKRLVTDGRLLGEIEQLQETLQLAKQAERFNSRGLSDESPRIERQLIELAEKAAESTILFVVKGLPAEEFDNLTRKHPPSVLQLERFREVVKAKPWADMDEWNPETLGLDLLAACLVEPKWSSDELETFWRSLTRGSQNELYDLAIKAQLSGVDFPFSNAAIATTNGGGEQSTSAVSGDSPSPNT